jgi:ribosomal protein L37AE/L43A
LRPRAARHGSRRATGTTGLAGRWGRSKGCTVEQRWGSAQLMQRAQGHLSKGRDLAGVRRGQLLTRAFHSQQGVCVGAAVHVSGVVARRAAVAVWQCGSCVSVASGKARVTEPAPCRYSLGVWLRYVLGGVVLQRAGRQCSQLWHSVTAVG